VLLLCAIADSLLGDGCRVEYGSVVKNSVLGSCAFIDKHCYIQVGCVYGWDFAVELVAGCVAGEGRALSQPARCGHAEFAISWLD
jgi:NDP-sugar pyrophosphorylase family protein